MALNGAGPSNPVVIVHGGAWNVPDHLLEGSMNGAKASARAAYQILKTGGSALDAVVAAVRVLEDDVCFDAGTGSVLNSKGEVEMDAIIMDGETLKAGGVACVQNIKNPIDLARLVMDETEHVLLVGKGANQFAEEMGVKTVPVSELVTAEAMREFACYKQYGNAVEELFGRKKDFSHDTVGAVALDMHGNIAYGMSTGGITAKRPGRVGDSPLVGNGGYADNEVGAVSCTGHGESIIKVCLAHSIISYMEQGMTAQVAAEKALMKMDKRVNGHGGVIVVGKNGDIGKFFTTPRMTWAWVKDNKLHYGIEDAEDNCEDFE
ncbi:hypothetical protein CHS0354_042608 [Potamilus streckersoni]|uniref:Uncharacterized protein n=1 Tax=Potamilus streckersoni TaxID=2493646 RepID=A0AAE0WCT1_9BIVA|nr:hypothetical protein CHS0354_042608 [Potamilus streckersoni]